MAEHDAPLARVLTGWPTYQGYLVQTVAPLTIEQLALRAGPHLRSVGTLAAHIIAARVSWFHRVLGEGPADLVPLLQGDDADPVTQDAAALAAGLTASWAPIAAGLHRWTLADLDEPFARRGETVTRGWVLWHVLEHDLHHGGELFLTCGMYGLAVPDI